MVTLCCASSSSKHSWSFGGQPMKNEPDAMETYGSADLALVRTWPGSGAAVAAGAGAGPPTEAVSAGGALTGVAGSPRVACGAVTAGAVADAANDAVVNQKSPPV